MSHAAPHVFLANYLASNSLTHPSKLTVKQLKSALSEAGVQLPTDQATKKVYVDLYEKALKPQRNPKNTPTQQRPTVPPRNTPTPTSTRKRKRDSEPPLRDEHPTRLVRGGADGNAFQKRKRKRVKPANEGDVEIVRDSAPLTSPQERDQKQRTNPFQNASTVANGNVRVHVESAPRAAATGARPSTQPRAEDLRNAPARRVSDGATAMTDDLSSISSSNSEKKRAPQVPPSRTAGRPKDSYVSSDLLSDPPQARRRKSQKSATGLENRVADHLSPVSTKFTAPKFNRFPPRERAASMAHLAEKSQSVCTVIVNVLLVLLTVIFLGALSFGAYKYYEQNRVRTLEMLRRPGEGLVYCDSEMTSHYVEGCVPCPEHGYCDGGDFIQCEPGYVWKDGLCVEDEQITREATAIIDAIRPRLARHRGKFECGYEGYSQKGILLKDLRDELQKEYVLSRSMPQAEFNAVFRKFKDLIEKYPFELTKTWIESEDHEELSDYSTEEDTVKMVYSERISRPILCVFKTFYETHRLYFMGFFTTVFIALILRTWLAKKRFQMEFYEEIKKNVLDRLRKEKQCVVVHLRDELKEYYKIDDGAWAHVVDRVQRDSRILEDVDAYNNGIWVWNSDLSSVDESKNK